MRRNGVCGALAAVALMAAGDGAYAATVVGVNCQTNGAGALSAQFVNGGTANTIYQITGPCDGNFQITQDNISITGPGGTQQTIFGEIDIGASGISLENLTIDGAGHSMRTVFLIGPAGVFIGNSTIQASVDDGVRADGPARVSIGMTTVQNNAGVGLHAIDGTVIDSENNTVTGNTDVGVLAEQNSTVRLLNTTVTGPSSNHTVLVSRASSAFVRSSIITADTPFSASNQLAVVAAARGSSIVLAGGNAITNNAAGGLAVNVSAGSTLEENNGSPFGFTQANDTIVGHGRIHNQSVIELGAAPGSATLTWDGNILLSQASSFRADGGNVTINGTLTLDQSANGYFNNFAGTSNSISSVVCNSTTDHVSNPTLVTPNVMIGPPPHCALF